MQCWEPSILHYEVHQEMPGTRWLLLFPAAPFSYPVGIKYSLSLSAKDFIGGRSVLHARALIHLGSSGEHRATCEPWKPWRDIGWGRGKPKKGDCLDCPLFLWSLRNGHVCRLSNPGAANPTTAKTKVGFKEPLLP